MNKNSKRQQQAQNTRKKIYKAAVKLFNKNEYKNVSINEIAKEAGVSIGLFYNYFSCKEDIIMEEFIKANKYYQDIYDQIPANLNSIDKLSLLMNRIFELSYENGKEWIRVPYVTLIGSDKRSLVFADEKRPFFTIIHNIIKKGQNKGEICQDFSPREITMQIIACMYGHYYSWLADDNWDLVKTWTAFFSIYLESIRAK